MLNYQRVHAFQRSFCNASKLHPLARTTERMEHAEPCRALALRWSYHCSPVSCCWSPKSNQPTRAILNSIHLFISMTLHNIQLDLWVPISVHSCNINHVISHRIQVIFLKHPIKVPWTIPHSPTKSTNTLILTAPLPLNWSQPAPRTHVVPASP